MADIEAHFHGGPLRGQTRTLDAGQSVYPFLDDVDGHHGEYVRNGELNDGRCFDWNERVGV